MSFFPRTEHGGIWLPEPGPIVLPSDEVVAEELSRLDMVPLRPDYVRIPFEQGFDGREVILRALEQGGLPIDSVLYTVDFASLRKPSADLAKLASLDDGAHREAVTSEGFLLYFRGDADLDGFNRSWCTWRSAQEARIATHKPAHLLAMACVEEMYDWYDVHMREMWLDRSMPGGYDMRLVRRVSAGQPPFADGPAVT